MADCADAPMPGGNRPEALLTAVREMQEKFDFWANMRTHYELSSPEDRKSLPVVEMNTRLIALHRQAKPLADWAESYDVDATALRSFAHDEGEAGREQRAEVRAVLSRLAGAVLKQIHSDMSADKPALLPISSEAVRAGAFAKTLDDLADVERGLSGIGPPHFIITSDGVTTKTSPSDYDAKLADYERENANLRQVRDTIRKRVTDSVVELTAVARRLDVDWKPVLRFATAWDKADQADAGVQAKMLAAYAAAPSGHTPAVAPTNPQPRSDHWAENLKANPQGIAGAANRAIEMLAVYFSKLYMANVPSDGADADSTYAHRIRYWHGYEDTPPGASDAEVATAKIKAVEGGKGITGMQANIINGVLPSVLSEAERCGMAETGRRVRDAASAWVREGFELIYPSGKRPWHIPVAERQLIEYQRRLEPIRADLLALAAARNAVEADSNRREAVIPRQPSASHSEDFTTVDWFGTAYVFDDGLQAKAVECLWSEYEKGGHGLSEKSIGERIGSASSNYRLGSTFRNHPAWNSMIVKVRQGVYRLKRPE
jgi:hypothetical protein